MKTEQRKWSGETGWKDITTLSLDASANLVMAFGATKILKDEEPLFSLKKKYPNAFILGCSTAGEILDTEVSDNTLVTTAVQFEHTELKDAKINLSAVDGNSFQAGASLAQSLDKK